MVKKCSLPSHLMDKNTSVEVGGHMRNLSLYVYVLIGSATCLEGLHSKDHIFFSLGAESEGRIFGQSSLSWELDLSSSIF
jgi:hypothetical protein